MFMRITPLAGREKKSPSRVLQWFVSFTTCEELGRERHVFFDGHLLEFCWHADDHKKAELVVDVDKAGGLVTLGNASSF